ncbi:MAG: TlpA family protein disulfide reductase [Solirubrobacteraceae bacterium]
MVSIAAVVLAVATGGCGGGGDEAGPGTRSQASPEDRGLAEAANVSRADFPAADGRSLQEIADSAQPGASVGLAVSVLVPGRNRVAFGLLDDANRVVYAKSAVYVASSPGAPAAGPYPAPADSLITRPEFRSRFGAAAEDPFAAIYGATVPFRHAGEYAVLVLSKQGSRVTGSRTRVEVQPDSSVPAVGERAPAVENDTLESAGGDIEAIETRVPPDDMHEVRFKDVLGKQPVALLFATPALCESRTCGPVTDILLQLKETYGQRMAFIHQEVFVDNDPAKGYRKPLRDFGLQSEPWLFTIDRRGRVATRLEGAFGLETAKRAIEAALEP